MVMSKDSAVIAAWERWKSCTLEPKGAIHFPCEAIRLGFRWIWRVESTWTCRVPTAVQPEPAERSLSELRDVQSADVDQIAGPAELSFLKQDLNVDQRKSHLAGL